MQSRIPTHHADAGRVPRPMAMVLCSAAVAALVLAMPVGRPLAEWLGVAVAIVLAAGCLAARMHGFGFAGLPWVAGFAAAGFASSALSAFAPQSWSRGAAGLLLMLAFPAAQVIGSDARARRAFGIVAVAAIVLAAGDIGMQALTGTSLILGIEHGDGTRRFAGSLPNPNESAFVAILAPLALCALEPGGRPSTAGRARTALTVACALVVVLLSGSRANFLGLLVGLGATGILLGNRRILLATGLAVLLAGAMVALDIGSVRTRALESLALHDDPRMRTWSIALSAFMERPWLGQGPCVFFEVNESSRSLAVERGWTTPAGGMPWVHSMPLEILCERGLVGLLLAAGVIVAAARGLRSGLRSAAAPTWCAGVAGSASAFLVIGLFDLSLLKDWCAALVWLIAGFAVACGRMPSAAGPEASREAG